MIKMGQVLSDRALSVAAPSGLYRPSAADAAAAHGILPELTQFVATVQSGDAIDAKLTAIPPEVRRAALMEIFLDPARINPLHYDVRKELLNLLAPRQLAILATEVISRPDGNPGVISEAFSLLEHNKYLPRAEKELFSIMRDGNRTVETRAEAALLLSRLGRPEYLNDLLEIAKLPLSVEFANDVASQLLMEFGDRGIRAVFEIASDASGRYCENVRAASLRELKYVALSEEGFGKLAAIVPTMAKTTEGQRVVLEFCREREEPGVELVLDRLISELSDQGEMRALALSLKVGRSERRSSSTGDSPMNPMQALDETKATGSATWETVGAILSNWSPEVERRIAADPELLVEFRDAFLSRATKESAHVVRGIAEAARDRPLDIDVLTALIRLGEPSGIERIDDALKSGKPYYLTKVAQALIESPHPDAPQLLFDLLNIENNASRNAVALGCYYNWRKGEPQQNQILERLEMATEVSAGACTGTQYADALRYHVSTGMTAPFRFPPQILVESHRNRTLGIPEGAEVAVALYAQADDLNAIHASGGGLTRYIQRGMTPLVFEVSSVPELIAADREIRRLLDGRKALVCELHGHGAPDAFALSQPDPATHSSRTGDGILSFKDLERLKEAHVFDWIDSRRGAMPVESCSVAGNWNRPDPDILKLLAQIAPPGVLIIGNSHPIQSEGSGPIFGKDNSVIDARFNSSVGGRRVRIRL